MAATEKNLDRIKVRVDTGKLVDKDKFGVTVGKVVIQDKVATHFDLVISDS